MVDLTQHSPLGGSGAYRWMPEPYGGNCPGSVRLSYGIEDEESEYSARGKEAHCVAEWCLTHGTDAWELIMRGEGPGEGYTLPNGEELFVDKPMADGVQVYLNAVRSYHVNFDAALAAGCAWVELEFHCPTIHEYCWGKADAVFLDEARRTLHVWDFKNGVLDVDVIENLQCMYYGACVLEKLGIWHEVDQVVLHICQPNGFSSDGPVREWAISIEDLDIWVGVVLTPAMDRALTSRDTASGEHCRFCPARARACPQILKDMDELETLVLFLTQTNDQETIMEKLKAKDAAAELTDTQVGRMLDLTDIGRIAGKAVGNIAYERSMAGHKIPGRKLVKARSNREWKDGAETDIEKKFGGEAYTEQKLKSPSEIEKLIGGEKMTARYAFKPDKGLTVARADDKRMAVDRDPAKRFKDQTKKGKK